MLDDIKRWIAIVRVEPIPLSIISIALGGGLADYYHKFDWLVFILASLTAACLHILCNIANDYGDYVTGADALNTSRPPSGLQLNIISLKDIRSTILWLSVLSVVFGVATILVSKIGVLDCVVFVSIGVSALFAAINYTIGKKPYGYNRLGEVSIMVFFGLVGVCGSFYLFAHEWKWIAVPIGIGYGCRVVGVLNINNIRDMEFDRLVNKNTLASWLGSDKVPYFQFGLSIIYFITSVVYSTYLFGEFWFLLQLPFSLLFCKIAKDLKCTDGLNMTRIFSQHILVTVVSSICEILVLILFQST